MAGFLQRFKDFAIGKLNATGISASDTTATLDSSSSVSNFPPRDARLLVWNDTDYPNDPASDPAKELMLYTGRDAGANQFTGLLRGLGGTSAAAHNTAGKTYRVIHCVTADDLEPHVVNIRAFGAKGDDLADDTTPITKAIEAVNALLDADGFTNGAHLVIPRGIYRVTAALPFLQGHGIVVEGGGTLKGVNIADYVLKMGSASYEAQIVRNVRIWAAGSTTGGILLHHNRSCLLLGVYVRNDQDGVSNTTQVGIEVRDGVFAGAIIGGQTHGNFGKFVKLTTGSFANKPNGFSIQNHWFNRSAPAENGTGLSLEVAANEVRSFANTFDGQGIGIDNVAADHFTSQNDRFDGVNVGYQIAAARAHIKNPNFSGASMDYGIDIKNGGDECCILYPKQNNAPVLKLIRVGPAAGSTVKRCRVEGEWGDLYGANFEDNGSNTVRIVQEEGIGGTVSFADTVGQMTVIFDGVVGDGSYQIVLMPESNDKFWVSSKTSAQFFLNRSATAGAATCGWRLVRI